VFFTARARANCGTDRNRQFSPFEEAYIIRARAHDARSLGARGREVSPPGCSENTGRRLLLKTGHGIGPPEPKIFELSRAHTRGEATWTHRNGPTAPAEFRRRLTTANAAADTTENPATAQNPAERAKRKTPQQRESEL